MKFSTCVVINNPPTIHTATRINTSQLQATMSTKKKARPMRRDEVDPERHRRHLERRILEAQKLREQTAPTEVASPVVSHAERKAREKAQVEKERQVMREMEQEEQEEQETEKAYEELEELVKRLMEENKRLKLENTELKEEVEELKEALWDETGEFGWYDAGN